MLSVALFLGKRVFKSESAELTDTRSRHQFENKTTMEMVCVSKQKPKSKQKPITHMCGAINGVMGKGAFAKEGDKYRCVECGKIHDKLPEGYMSALKKISPKRAALLEKGVHQKTTGAEHDKWSAAGHKAWETRKANEAARNKNKSQAKKSTKK